VTVTARLVVGALVVASACRAMFAGDSVANAAPLAKDAGRAEAAKDAVAESAALDSDARPPACVLEVSGALTIGAEAGCELQRFDNATDAGPRVDFLLATPPVASESRPSIRVFIGCSGKPPIGQQQGWPPPGCQHVDARVSKDGVEWVGMSGIQGTFALRLTEVRAIKTAGGREGYEVHGVLDSTLPVSNTFDPPVALHATF
jgi:hypothetical protein